MKKLFLLFSVLFLLISCETTKQLSCVFSENTEFQWKTVQTGIEETYFKNGKSAFHAVKIDFEKADLEVLSNPITGKMQKTGSVKAFARKNKTVVAFNTTPFYIKTKINLFSPGKPAGITIQNQKLITEPHDGYCAMAFFQKENTIEAKIYSRQKDILLENPLPKEACGGFWIILQNGSIKEFSDIKDYRMGAATLNSGKTMIVMAASSASYGDCAKVFMKMGAEEAMQFDGGSSSSLIVKNRRKITCLPVRNVPSILGFRSKPFDNSLTNNN